MTTSSTFGEAAETGRMQTVASAATSANATTRHGFLVGL